MAAKIISLWSAKFSGREAKTKSSERSTPRMSCEKSRVVAELRRLACDVERGVVDTACVYYSGPSTKGRIDLNSPLPASLHDRC